MPEGVQYPDMVDKVLKGKDGSVVLVMREDRPWDGSEPRIVELRNKINTCAAYARQGRLVKDYPDLADRPVSFQLSCIQHRPDPKLMRFLDQANVQLAPHSLRINVRVVEAGIPGERREDSPPSKNPGGKLGDLFMPTLICKQVWFDSPGDELSFFQFAGSLKGVRKIEGVGDEIHPHLPARLSQASLRRHKIEMRRMRRFGTANKKGCLRCESYL